MLVFYHFHLHSAIFSKGSFVWWKATQLENMTSVFLIGKGSPFFFPPDFGQDAGCILDWLPVKQAFTHIPVIKPAWKPLSLRVNPNLMWLNWTIVEKNYSCRFFTTHHVIVYHYRCTAMENTATLYQILRRHTQSKSFLIEPQKFGVIVKEKNRLRKSR